MNPAEISSTPAGDRVVSLFDLREPMPSARLARPALALHLAPGFSIRTPAGFQSRSVRRIAETGRRYLNMARQYPPRPVSASHRKIQVDDAVRGFVVRFFHWRVRRRSCPPV